MISFMEKESINGFKNKERYKLKVKILDKLKFKISEMKEQQEEKDKPKRSKRKAISKDIRIALNTIKQSLSMVTKSGIHLKTEEEDNDEYYQITVRIPKKK